MSSPGNCSVIWKVFLLFAVFPLTNPYSVTFAGKAHQFWLVWRGIVLTTSCSLIGYTYWHREAILFYADLAGQVNDIFQYVSLSLTGLVVIVETFRKQSHYVEIWKIVARIQKLGQSTAVDQQLNKQFALKFWMCLLMFIASEIRVLTKLAINDDQWLQMWTVNILPLAICYLMLLLHVYYFNLLASYFQYIQKELEEVVTFAKYSMFVKLDRSLIARRLDALKDVYGLLFQASGCVNAIFIWSQAFNFTRMFLHSTCDLNWFYKEVDHDYSILVCNLIPRIVSLLLLLHDANVCVEHASSLAPLLFQIKFTDGEWALQRMIHQFAAQISHEPISFGGLDLYTINYGLLRIMIAGIITYMIVFIQMMPTIK